MQFIFTEPIVSLKLASFDNLYKPDDELWVETCSNLTSKVSNKTLHSAVLCMPVPMAARSTAPSILGSNPTGGMNVCLLCVVCCQVEGCVLCVVR
jgi:hypothetical protein